MSRLLLCFLLCICSSGAAIAAEDDLLFRSSEPLAVTLTGPFSAINRERNKDKEYTGTLSYVDDAAGELVFDVSLEVRGNWRLDRGHCRYPPLWINLKRGQTPGTVFENQNRLKIVVQCDRSDRYVDYLYKELQAYELFSELSEYHFATRSLSISYADDDQEDDIRTQPAFFIEHQNRLAARFGFSEVELNTVPNLELNRLQSTLVSMFMYFIGNTDFSIIQGMAGDECCHNAKQLQDGDGEYYGIPYDFDASGFVDTNYAPEPNPRFRLRNNRVRLYRGFCVERSVLDEAVAIFQEKRERIYAIVRDSTLVSQRASNRNTDFVDDFFDSLEDPQQLERAFIDSCRG
jgi:hypothetical protein